MLHICAILALNLDSVGSDRRVPIVRCGLPTNLDELTNVCRHSRVKLVWLIGHQHVANGGEGTPTMSVSRSVSKIVALTFRKWRNYGLQRCVIARFALRRGPWPDSTTGEIDLNVV